MVDVRLECRGDKETFTVPEEGFQEILFAGLFVAMRMSKGKPQLRLLPDGAWCDLGCGRMLVAELLNCKLFAQQMSKKVTKQPARKPSRRNKGGRGLPSPQRR